MNGNKFRRTKHIAGAIRKAAFRAGRIFRKPVPIIKVEVGTEAWRTHKTLMGIFSNELKTIKLKALGLELKMLEGERFPTTTGQRIEQQEGKIKSKYPETLIQIKRPGKIAFLNGGDITTLASALNIHFVTPKGARIKKFENIGSAYWVLTYSDGTQRNIRA